LGGRADTPARDGRSWGPRLIVLVALIGALAIALLSQLEGGPDSSREEPISVDASEPEIVRAFGAVRAGRKLTPRAWPGGARVAVALSFDVDHELLTRKNPLPAAIAQGEYGATTGLPRILALLDRHGVPATFYVPAAVAILHPQTIPAILASGRHEIGAHGWMHESPEEVRDAEHEKQLLERSIESLTNATGRRPVGFRAPYWVWSSHTLGHLLDAGFLYDSSLMAMDEPYEIVADGEATGLIELPVSWILDDFPYYGAGAGGALPSPKAVHQIYRDEFDAAYEERTLFVLTLHPHVSGHRSRIAELDRLIAYMKGKPGVWFATLEQIATAVAPPERAR
jgi:peptidoglycan/xylan/chitin deacetylase (PgdA/CDA1 family)